MKYLLIIFCLLFTLLSCSENNANIKLIKSLDIKNFPIHYLPFIQFNKLQNKNLSNCVIDLSNEDKIKFVDIVDICKEFNPILKWNVFSEDFMEIDDYNNEYLVIKDYNYSDYNNDGYLDLILNILENGNYSASGTNHKIILTSVKEGQVSILDYSNSYNVIPPKN